MCGRVGRPVGACVTDVCTHFFFCRTSSVKFGNSSDSTRASDPQLRVLGISNLRIGVLYEQCSYAVLPVTMILIENCRLYTKKSSVYITTHDIIAMAVVEQQLCAASVDSYSSIPIDSICVQLCVRGFFRSFLGSLRSTMHWRDSI